MKILTIFATASAVALVSASAFAAKPINPENAVRQSIYDVSRHNGEVIAARRSVNVSLMSSRQTVAMPQPINRENEVRQSINDTSRHDDRVIARRIRGEGPYDAGS